MKIQNTNIPDVKILIPTRFGDERGFFMESFRAAWFEKHVSPVHFVQDNHSKSSQGILRGLHYQIVQPQGKLVRVVAGEVYDVAVDMRQSSPNFGQAVGAILSAENCHQLWVPPGFAHGFYVLSDSVEFVYKCTDYYAPEHERSLLWNDPLSNIDWPLINDQVPFLSDKDSDGILFAEADYYA